MNCTKCGKEVKTIQKDLSTPRAGAIWANIERAAASCPKWIKERVKHAAKNHARKIAENPVCGACEYAEAYG